MTQSMRPPNCRTCKQSLQVVDAFREADTADWNMPLDLIAQSNCSSFWGPVMTQARAAINPERNA